MSLLKNDKLTCNVGKYNIAFVSKLLDMMSVCLHVKIGKAIISHSESKTAFFMKMNKEWQ